LRDKISSGRSSEFILRHLRNSPRDLILLRWRLVGDENYHCPSFVANFISPLIYHLHSSDRTTREYHVQTTDLENQFPRLLSLRRGGTISVKEKNCDFFQSICGGLQNG
jgi:hypothetical protein